MASLIRSLAILLALALRGSDPGSTSAPAEAAPNEAGSNTVDCPEGFRERFVPGPVSPGPCGSKESFASTYSRALTA